ncbi:MAG: phytanoyl-CoA dioxygenase family protein, partial [Candidatus Eremiobacteraeota bacterium]|nr:phytanoyl-CoA dioxygenase family protein [Candidatus Eremiobacteraeota bacterium]
MPFDLDSVPKLEEATIGAFERDGFVRIKSLLSAHLLDHFGPQISQEVARRNPITVPLDERDTYHRAFIQVTNLWRTSDIAKAFVFSKCLASAAAMLLRVPRVRLYHDQALIKEPGGGYTPWHADQFYWPLDSAKTITAWVPLQTVPLEMGPIAFARGSHTMTFGRDLEISDESERRMRSMLLNGSYPEDAAAFDLGDVSFHSGWTFHHTGPNKTDQPRAVMTIIYMADGIRLISPQRSEHYADWEAFMPGIQPGEIVNSKL